MICKAIEYFKRAFAIKIRKIICFLILFPEPLVLGIRCGIVQLLRQLFELAPGLVCPALFRLVFRWFMIFDRMIFLTEVKELR